MKVPVVVGCNLAFVLADMVVTTVLYVQGSHLNVFENDVQNFDVRYSLLDLWGMMLVRSCFLLGGSVGVLWNRSDGPERVASLGTLVVLVELTVLTYAVAKLLMFSEEDGLVHEPWFLALFSWTCIAAVVTGVLWKMLAKSSTNDGVQIREGREERERLVDEGEVEEKEGEETEEEGEESGREEGKGKKGTKGQPNSGATLGRLLYYCKEDAGLLSFAFFFLLVFAISEAFIPYYIGQAIDAIVIHKSMDYFAKPMITFSILALVSSLAIGFRGGVFSLTFARLNVRLRNLLFRSLMQQEMAFFDANHTGDITSRLTSDTTQVSDLISQNVNLFLRSVVKAIGFFIFMFGLSWKLSLVTILAFPYIAVISSLYGEYYKKLTKAVQTSLAEANKVAEETISAMRTVRSFANENREADSYYQRLQDVFKLNKKQALAYACFMWSSCISELALQVVVLFYGGHLVVTNQMSGGELISFIIYELELGECLEVRFESVLQSIASVYTGLMQGVGAAEKVFEYIDRKPKHGNDGQEAPETFTGLVEFNNVTFAYPTRPKTDVLKNVSFSIRPGEVTALVGPSGSGKSSCVCLLENFYKPQQGQVLLDGRPVETYRHDYHHSKVALVGQEPVLFARSVHKNISYGVPDAPMDVVVSAATKANAHDFICGLSKGYDTGVGEKGTQLSGGQKQRVAIARALVTNPGVLVLDEATSALDAESEHVVQQALNSIMTSRTVLVVAHRLSTVERAHNIVVLDRGSVVEQGRHDQLMARQGLYHRLVQRQVLGFQNFSEAPRPSIRKAEDDGSGGEKDEAECEQRY